MQVIPSLVTSWPAGSAALVAENTGVLDKTQAYRVLLML